LAKAAHSEEYEKELNRYKKEIEELKLKSIQQQYEQERKALEAKSIYEQQRYYMDIDRRKRDDFYHYQEHRRDSAVELIKLTAAVLSFAGTVYLLATKMNK
jgi:FMN phosphatase YigB (HAD superfamily)